MFKLFSNLSCFFSSCPVNSPPYLLDYISVQQTETLDQPKSVGERLTASQMKHYPSRDLALEANSNQRTSPVLHHLEFCILLLHVWVCWCEFLF